KRLINRSRSSAPRAPGAGACRPGVAGASGRAIPFALIEQSCAIAGPRRTTDIMKTIDPRRNRARTIVKRLARLYPDAKCALEHENPLQLLIATILSAQCTDARVNIVTPALFARYRDAAAFAAADPR